MSNTDTARLGRDAAAVKPVLDRAMSDLRAELNRTLMALPINSEHVLTTHAALIMINKVEAAINGIVGSGLIAKDALIKANIITGEQ